MFPFLSIFEQMQSMLYLICFKRWLYILVLNVIFILDTGNGNRTIFANRRTPQSTVAKRNELECDVAKRFKRRFNRDTRGRWPRQSFGRPANDRRRWRRRPEDRRRQEPRQQLRVEPRPRLWRLRAGVFISWSGHSVHADVGLRVRLPVESLCRQSQEYQFLHWPGTNWSMWPDLTKFRNFGKKTNPFGNFWYFAKKLT